MTAARILPHPACITVADAMHDLNCTKATAYRHMRRAVNRMFGARGILRVPIETWRQYVEEVIRCGSSSAARPGTAGSTSQANKSSALPAATIEKLRSFSPANGNARRLIPHAQPRTRRR